MRSTTTWPTRTSTFLRPALVFDFFKFKFQQFVSKQYVESIGYDPTKRAYPDVAVLGHNYGIVIGGSTYYGSGTSASSPVNEKKEKTCFLYICIKYISNQVFAAFVTLVNGQRIAKGKSPVGFLNPALYAMVSLFFYYYCCFFSNLLL